jgi:hypothetical protein
MTAPRVELDTSAKGLLARLGHDLRLAIERFDIEVAEGTVQGRFELGSLRVIGTLHGERCDTSAPSASDRAQIERTVRDEILHAERYGDAVWRGRVRIAPRLEVQGELTLCGRTAPLELAVARSPGELRAEVALVPSRFGIAPYKALGGALKVADRVLLRASLPLDDRPEAELLQLSARWRAG